MRKVVLLGLLFAAAFSCKEDDADLPPVEQRVSEAIATLHGELTAPANGWRLNYRPTNASGTFFILLKFTEDGSVQIQSDVPANNGAFYNETITYRIDSGLGLELIFETFAVFHHLFELDQATFGGEFEFQYVEKTGDNLVFESISDFSFPTVITLEPADADDADSFAREVAENMEEFNGTFPSIVGIPPSQHIYFSDRNLSLFWTIDITRRTVHAEVAGVGATEAEVLMGNPILLDHTTGYTFRDGKLILTDPVSFNLGGQMNTIDELTLNSFSNIGPSLCPSSVVTENPQYEGSIAGIGSLVMYNSLLSTRGIAFGEDIYQGGSLEDGPLIFNGSDERISIEGSIQQKFPTAVGFILFNGVELNDPAIPIYSLGLFLPDENGDNNVLYLREFTPVETEVNRVIFDLTDNYYFSHPPEPTTQADLEMITDEIFEGGQLYAFFTPFGNVTVVTLFNPCNGYEVIFVQ